MNWLEFSVEMVKALVWPLLVVVALVIIRKPLSELVPYLKRLKVGELEAEFEKSVREIRDNLDRELLAKDKKAAAVIPQSELEDLTQLAEIAPNAAVLETWKTVELAAKKLIASRGYKLDYNTSMPYRLIERILRKANLVEMKKIKVFDELRRLRNKIAHAADFEISSVQAREYIGLANSLRAYLLLEAKKKK
jgi:hypothetical protein